MGKIAKFNSSKSLENRGGFTIVELLIATAVFSIVLMAAVSGFLEIGRLFYKGTVANATQNTTKQVLDRISADIQNSSAVVPITPPNPPSNLYTYFCAGGVRYTLNFDKRLDTSASPDYSATGNFGILRDELPGATACASPTQTAFISPQELLANNIRLSTLTITSVNGQNQLYNIQVRLIAGNDSSLVKVNPTLPLTGSNVRCDSNLRISQFCSVSYMSNVVFGGGF